MKSSEFLMEGDDKNVEDVRNNHPEIYKFIVKLTGAMALEKYGVVEAYNTANSHMVQIKIKPSAGLGNIEIGLEQEGIPFESIPNPVGGEEVLSGSIGEMHWTIADDGNRGNRTETWRFAMPHANDEVATYHDRTMEEDVDKGEPEKLDLHSVFGSDAANVLSQEGFKFYEKPSYWTDLERTAMDSSALITAEYALEDAGMTLPEYDAWEIFPINPGNKYSVVTGPLETIENMPPEKVFVIHNLPYGEDYKNTKVGTFLVDTHGAGSYIRSWIMIK